MRDEQGKRKEGGEERRGEKRKEEEGRERSEAWEGGGRDAKDGKISGRIIQTPRNTE